MDKHIAFIWDYAVKQLKHSLLDNKINNISWWTEKHHSHPKKALMQFSARTGFKRSLKD